MNNNAGIEQISQRTDRTEPYFHDIYEEASSVAGRVLETMQALAGTTSCKGVQISELEKWAKENNFWIDNIELFGAFADRGSENEVYVTQNGTEIIKLNDFRYSDDNLTPFFNRILAHNFYFPNCGYELVGMSKNKEGKTCAVLVQPFVVAEREATIEEINIEMQRMGFTPDPEGDSFSNGFHDIYDALPNNVLIGVDGRPYFIDTIIYTSSSENTNTYRKQSPRYSI